MQLPDHKDLHGCAKVILGDILECSIVDIFKLPVGSRIHARWDTIICGERRTIRETFEDKHGRGSAQQQLEDYRPIAQFCFESEERVRAKYGEDLPMPEIPNKRESVSEALEAAAAHGAWRPSLPPTVRLLIVLAEEVKRLREREWSLRLERSVMAFAPENVREPMPYIVPSVVRVCTLTDSECSRGCGDGPCKRGGDGGAV